jgi:DNA-binding winged helix-turn-helix (wHTH) protein
MATCPRCHQPIKHERCGVYLPPRKAAIIDALKDAGDEGISLDKFIAVVWKAGKRRTPNTVYSHISQLNSLLVNTSYAIRTERQNGATRFYLTRERKKVA